MREGVGILPVPSRFCILGDSRPYFMVGNLGGFKCNDIAKNLKRSVNNAIICL